MPPSLVSIDSLVKITPTSILTFNITLKEQTIVKMQLENITDDEICYKMKTTDTKRYSVRPNAAVLQPHSILTIVITQKAFSDFTPDFNICNDLFQLLVIRLKDVPSHHPILGDETPTSTDESLPLGYPSLMKLWEFAPPTYIAKKKFPVTIQLGKSINHEQLTEDTQPDDTLLEQKTQPVRKLDTAPLPSSEGEHTQITSIGVGSVASIQNPDSISKQVSDKVSTPTAIPKPLENVSKPGSSKTSSQVRTTNDFTRAVPKEPTPVNEITPSTRISSMKKPAPMTPTKKKNAVADKGSGSSGIDYRSVEFAKERAVQMRTAPKIVPPETDIVMRQRVAVERAGELVKVINCRQKEIDAVKKDLLEARHKLSDAKAATQPAYDVRYEINESARVPLIQICIMAIISGALLQLLV